VAGVLEKLEALSKKIDSVIGKEVEISIDSSNLEKLSQGIDVICNKIGTGFAGASKEAIKSLSAINEITLAGLKSTLEELKTSGSAEMVALAEEVENQLNELNGLSLEGLTQEFDSVKNASVESISSLQGITGELNKLNNIDLSGLKSALEQQMKAAADAAIIEIDRIKKSLDALDGKVVTVTVRVVEKKG